MNKIKTYNWLAVLIWAAVIFFFSHQPYLDAPLPTAWSFALRKSAHVGEFFIFTLLLIRALTTGIDNKQNNKKTVILALLLSIFYATTDEYHQGFIEGRHPSLKDIGFDTLGVALAAYFYFLFKKIKKKII